MISYTRMPYYKRGRLGKPKELTFVGDRIWNGQTTKVHNYTRICHTICERRGEMRRPDFSRDIDNTRLYANHRASITPSLYSTLPQQHPTSGTHRLISIEVTPLTISNREHMRRFLFLFQISLELALLPISNLNSHTLEHTHDTNNCSSK